MAHTLMSFANLLTAAIGEIATHERHGLTKGATILEAEMKRVLGTYDYGPVPLKPATIARKQTGDSPLLETGELRDSVEKSVGNHEAMIGSDNPKATWHVLGTPTIPPRDFMSGAARLKEAEIVECIGGEIGNWKLIKG